MAEHKQLPGVTQNPNAWPPIYILLRAESDDPWSSDVHTLDLYVLHPEHTSPDTMDNDITNLPCLVPLYHFPPQHIASFPSARGHLRCTDIHLGSRGTAVWIQPRPTRNLGLTAFDVHASDAQGADVHPLTRARIVRQESLVSALLPGVLKGRRKHGAAEGEGKDVRTLLSLAGSGGSWTSVDYDEERGLVALGESTGMVTILKLG